MSDPLRRAAPLATLIVALTLVAACKRPGGSGATPLDAHEATLRRTPSESARVIAHGTIRAESLVRANGEMVWLEDRPDGAVVVRAPLGGGPLTTLPTGKHPTALVVDARAAYVGGDDGVLAIPLDGAPPVTIVDEAPLFVTLAVDAGDVYFVLGKGSAGGCGCCGCWKPRDVGLIRVSKSMPSGAKTALYRDWGVSALALDDDAAYVVDRGQLLRIPKAGGPPEPVATDVREPLALDAHSVYGVAPDGQLLRVPKLGGPPVALGERDPGIAALALSEDAVYVASARTLGRIAAVGGATRLLYRDRVGMGAPRALALDGDGVWVSWTAVPDAPAAETWILRVGR